MKRVIYLFGAGAIQAEITRQSIEVDATMKGLNEQVYKMSQNCNGEYYRLTQRHPIPQYQDVELMMSLLEGFAQYRSKDFVAIHEELRKFVRECLIGDITQRKIEPKLMIGLLHICRNYQQNMGIDGEKLLGVLTTNYDSLIEEAFLRIYRGLNIGCEFHSKNYEYIEEAPFLLKLHGSFNWRVKNDKLEIERSFESMDCPDDYSGWMPPSVYKKPSTRIFESVWDRASELLTHCDILRVIGSSLRSEDWCLVSLIFTSRILNRKAFDIELIVPELDAVGDERHPNSIMQRLSFLGETKPVSALPVFDVNMMRGNIFLQWLINKANEIERKGVTINQDKLVNEMLYGDKAK